MLVPNAQANLAKIPDGVTDEQVVLLADIASTGFCRRRVGGVRIGDAVVVFAQGPIGLCATAGAKLMGASLVIGVDSDPVRLAMARRMGADVVLDFTQVDVVAEVRRLTGGGADVAIEALGTQATFENALRCLRPGGTLSSLGVYSGKLQMPYDAFAAGLGDHRIVTTLCPGGKERMRRLIATVAAGRFDPLPLITHRFTLADIVEAYDLFSNRRDGVSEGRHPTVNVASGAAGAGQEVEALELPTTYLPMLSPAARGPVMARHLSGEIDVQVRIVDDAHRGLAGVVARIPRVAELAGSLAAHDLESSVSRLVRSLEASLGPHATWEDTWLYPRIADQVGRDWAARLMRFEHAQIRRAICGLSWASRHCAMNRATASSRSSVRDPLQPRRSPPRAHGARGRTRPAARRESPPASRVLGHTGRATSGGDQEHWAPGRSA